MGISRTNSFLVSLDLDNMVLSDEAFHEEVLECPEKKRTRARKLSRRQNRRRMLMKRRARLEGYGKPQSQIERKVRTLKKLIPDSEAMSLDGLFMQTADYILSLQMEVRVMQILVNVLTGCDE